MSLASLDFEGVGMWDGWQYVTRPTTCAVPRPRPEHVFVYASMHHIDGRKIEKIFTIVEKQWDSDAATPEENI